MGESFHVRPVGTTEGTKLVSGVMIRTLHSTQWIQSFKRLPVLLLAVLLRPRHPPPSPGTYWQWWLAQAHGQRCKGDRQGWNMRRRAVGPLVLYDPQSSLMILGGDRVASQAVCRKPLIHVYARVCVRGGSQHSESAAGISIQRSCRC